MLSRFSILYQYKFCFRNKSLLMSQRSILAFLSPNNTSNSNQSSKSTNSKLNDLKVLNTGDSPVKSKTVTKRGGRRIIESDEEDEQSVTVSSPPKDDTKKKPSNLTKSPASEDNGHSSSYSLPHTLTADGIPFRTTAKRPRRVSENCEDRLKEEPMDVDTDGLNSAQSVKQKHSKTNNKNETVDQSIKDGVDIQSIEDKVHDQLNSKEKIVEEEKSSAPTKINPFFQKKSAEKQNKNKSSKDETTLTNTENKTSASRDNKEDVESSDLEKTTNVLFSNKSSTTTIIGSDYNPAKSNYHPINDAFWKHQQKTPYLALARTLEVIESTSSRLKMIEILRNFLRSVTILSPNDLKYAIYLCLNKLAPAYEGIELGIGETLLMKVIAQSTGRGMDKIKADCHEHGDIGIVAEMSRSNQRTMFKPADLTLPTVFNKLREIALMSGNSVMSKKIDKIKALFVACRMSEARFLIRSLSGKLRIGLAEQSVLVAIGHALAMTPPSTDYPPQTVNTCERLSSEALKHKLDEASLIIKNSYCECPNYDAIIEAVLKFGLLELPNHCKLSPGVPLKPMLAHPTKGIGEVLSRFDNVRFTCEYKYDGERAQIHILDNERVQIYSRNQENNTSKYPDVIGRISNAFSSDVTSAIIDSEAVAWDKVNNHILPFQVLSTRKRKDAKESEITVQVCIYAFDLLYLNGLPLIREPFHERRRLLKESFKEIPGEFLFACSMTSSNTEEIGEFLEESIKGNCEGLMVKTLDVDATYEIAKRSHNWLKLKKDYLDGIGDTIDVVPIGGYLGTGKRAGKYGGFLLAIFDEEKEEFQSICKIGTGFKDEELDSHAKYFKEHVISSSRSYFRVDASLKPDHWFEPSQVWEIKCADLSISPLHFAAAGLVDPVKGISLRFPRFLRIRDDKKPEQSTNSTQIAELYRNQDQIKNVQDTSKKIDEEDFY